MAVDDGPFQDIVNVGWGGDFLWVICVVQNVDFETVASSGGFLAGIGEMFVKTPVGFDTNALNGAFLYGLFGGTQHAVLTGFQTYFPSDATLENALFYNDAAFISGGIGIQTWFIGLPPLLAIGARDVVSVGMSMGNSASEQPEDYPFSGKIAVARYNRSKAPDVLTTDIASLDGITNIDTLISSLLLGDELSLAILDGVFIPADTPNAEQPELHPTVNDYDVVFDDVDVVWRAVPV